MLVWAGGGRPEHAARWVRGAAQKASPVLSCGCVDSRPGPFQLQTRARWAAWRHSVTLGTMRQTWALLCGCARGPQCVAPSVCLANAGDGHE